MPAHSSVDETGRRIEEILGMLRASADPRTGAAAEELVRQLVTLYGAGLERIAAVLADDTAAGPALLEQLGDDPLVGSLLLLHGLHPLDVETRVQRALDRVRPYLGSHAGGVDYLGVDDEGVLHLRLQGSCHGCPSSTVTVQLAIETAVEEAAPELAGVAVEGVVDEAAAQGPVHGSGLLQIGRRPPAHDGAGEPAGWVQVPGHAGPPPAPVVVPVEGLPVLLCGAAGTAYAYRDGCPRCGATLAGAGIVGTVLRCPSCGGGYDVHLAGASLDDPTLRLEPVPLLAGGGALLVALPSAVPR